MDSLFTIIFISVILVACVSGITVIQKREKAKEQLRQQVAKFRFRANETASILDNFANIPIGEEARGLLLQYIKLNLSSANKLAPSDPHISRNLASVNRQLQDPRSAVDEQRLNIPKDTQQLNILIKNLSKLGKYLLRFKTIKTMTQNIIPIAVNKIMLLISEAKICAYIQQGQKALTEHNDVNAQRFFQTAQKMLDKFKNKNSRLIALESELKGLVNLTPVKTANKKLNIDKEVINTENSEQDSIFGPKKKW